MTFCASLVFRKLFRASLVAFVPRGDATRKLEFAHAATGSLELVVSLGAKALTNLALA